MDPVNSPAPYQNDEIDLFELFESLWKEKFLIVAITLVITLIGGGVAFSLPPTYQASVHMLPPSLSDVAELSKFDVLKSSQSQSQSQSYAQFLQLLKSNQVHKELLRDKELQKALFKEPVSVQKGLKALDNLAVVNEPKKGPSVAIELTFDSQDPKLAADAANKLVELGINAFQKQTLEAFSASKDQVVKTLKAELESLLNTHEQRIDAELAKMHEALTIAKALNLKEPRATTDLTVKTESRSPIVTEELRYLYSQGSNALEAEIIAVKARKNNLNLVSGVAEIQKRLDLISSVSFDSSKVIPLTIDLAAEPPEQRIKPKRSLIVALSAVVGGMLAIMFVLIRNAVRNRKTVS